ncbi:hypothetical protein CLM62_15685 [Streptomyces sp. SA15]|nr:hypothetical protein CLM62_15685 [Streptomyces sp. SA15]
MPAARCRAAPRRSYGPRGCGNGRGRRSGWWRSRNSHEVQRLAGGDIPRRPPTADRRPPTADRRPPTADRRRKTA